MVYISVCSVMIAVCDCTYYSVHHRTRISVYQTLLYFKDRAMLSYLILSLF